MVLILYPIFNESGSPVSLKRGIHVWANPIAPHVWLAIWLPISKVKSKKRIGCFLQIAEICFEIRKKKKKNRSLPYRRSSPSQVTPSRPALASSTARAHPFASRPNPIQRERLDSSSLLRVSLGSSVVRWNSLWNPFFFNFESVNSFHHVMWILYF